MVYVISKISNLLETDSMKLLDFEHQLTVGN